ncbi:hypothetical protein HMPREF9062_1146 [Actinomyces sp. oral taxon 448 str. F0400]|nr:hypothetical protein HMPREF9062_1146 [Actinomyces sp. oral taxon 448 str. F0400]
MQYRAAADTLGVGEILLVHRVDCGMSHLEGRTFADSLAGATGVRPTWRPGGSVRRAGRH